MNSQWKTVREEERNKGTKNQLENNEALASPYLSTITLNVN